MEAEIVAQDNAKENLKRKLKLDTKGCCFLCLTVIDFKTEEKNGDGDHEPDNDGEGTGIAALKSKEHSSASLRILNRYLNINLDKLLPSKSSSSDVQKESSSLSSLKQTEDVKVDLCESCGTILEKFSMLALALEKIQMEMDYWQGRIHQQISNASKVPDLVQNYSKRMTSDPETLTQLVFVDNLRKEISKMALQKSKTGLGATIKINRLDLKVLKKTQVNPARNQTLIPAPVQVVMPATIEEPRVACLLKFELQEEYDEDEVEHTPPDSPHSMLTSPSLCRPATYSKKCNDGSDKNLLRQAEVGITSVYNSKTGKYGCTKCKKEFSQRHHARDHYDAIHLHRKWKCDICNKSTFPYQQDLRRHKKTCRNSLQKRLSAFKANQNDPSYKFPCFTCGKKFKRHFDMIMHNRLVHLKERNHACDLCGKTFLYSSHLKVHKNAVHLGITFKCGTCSKEFKSSSWLKEHQRKCANKSGAGAC